MKSDLIRREDAIKAMSETLVRLFPAHQQIAEKCINALPSAEPEQVIRCKDCKHRAVVRDSDIVEGFGLEFPDDECPCNCDDPFYAFRPADDWYCARGEKKETKSHE